MTNRRRQRSAFVATATLTALAVSACGGDSNDSGDSGEKDTEITVGYSGGGAMDGYMEQLLDRAAKELPDVTIKPVVYPTYDDQLNQLPTEFAGGTAPDIILWDNSAPVAQYASEGVITPVTDLIEDTGIDLSAYPEVLVDGWTFDDQLYGVPAYLQNSGFVYNLDVLAQAGVTEPPRTLDDLQASAAAVKEKTGKAGIVLLDNLFHLTQYMLAFGGGYENGETINSDENVEALEFLVGLFQDGTAATAQQLGAAWDGEAIANGKAAMSDGGPWYIGFMSTTAPKVDYELLPMPGPTPDDQVVATYGGAFSITESTSDPETALQVVEILTDEQAQEAIITSGLGYVPAMTEQADAFREATPEYAAFTEEVLASGRGLDYPPQTAEFGNELVSGFQQLIADPDDASPRDLLDDLQEKYGT